MKSIQNANNSLKELDNLVKELDDCTTRADYYEIQMGEWRKKARELAEHKIPELMESLGQEILRTTSGITVELKENVYARIPKKREQEAFDWLHENNEGGLIREEVVRRVHPMTLKSWVRGKLEEGKAIPEDLFGVYVQKVAKIK